MFDFIKKSPFGFILAVAGVILVVSPEAREAARKAAVKAAAGVLDFVDKAKNSAVVDVKGYLPGESGEGEPANHNQTELT